MALMNRIDRPACVKYTDISRGIALQYYENKSNQLVRAAGATISKDQSKNDNSVMFLPFNKAHFIKRNGNFKVSLPVFRGFRLFS